MQARNVEGVATHNGPESCVGAGNCDGEALTGERAGQVSSREMEIHTGVPTPWSKADGHIQQTASARRVGTQRRTPASDGLERVRQAARRDRKQRFTALLHHVYDLARLRAAYLALSRDAAAGVDGETWRQYGETLEENLRDLAARVKRGAFRASPVRRVYIPKADGRQRPLGVPTL